MTPENAPPTAGTEEAAAAKEVLNKMLEGYPAKTLRKRAKQALVNDPENVPQIGANSRKGDFDLCDLPGGIDR